LPRMPKLALARVIVEELARRLNQA